MAAPARRKLQYLIAEPSNPAFMRPHLRDKMVPESMLVAFSKPRQPRLKRFRRGKHDRGR